MTVELPKVIEEIEQDVGLTAALRLVEAFGGVRVHFPARLPDDHQLVKVLGPDAAFRLCQRYAGEAVDVPRCVALVRAKRNNEIRARCDAGESARTLARAYGMTERNVWYILGTPDAELPELTVRDDPRQRRLPF